jgi:hypothetical protein
MYLDKFWTVRTRFFGFIVPPGDQGGHVICLRLGKRSFRVEAEAWKDD